MSLRNKNNKLDYKIPKCKYDALWTRSGGGYHKYLYKDAKMIGQHYDMLEDYYTADMLADFDYITKEKKNG